jgi:hypothetical protein
MKNNTQTEGEEKMKIVEIEWEDAGSNKEVWSDIDNYPEEPGLCTTIGYLIKKTEKAYVLSQSSSDTQYGNVFVIPIRMAKKFKIVK